MSSASKQQSVDCFADDANQRVLDHLFEEYERVRIEKETIEARLNRFGETIQTMLASLSSTTRGEYETRFTRVKTGHSPRGGDAFNNVIWLFQQQPRKIWTVPEIKDALENAGRPVSNSKAVSNAISYLERSGRIRRVGWGQYVLVKFGAGIEINGYEDGTVRNSEHFV